MQQHTNAERSTRRNRPALQPPAKYANASVKAAEPRLASSPPTETATHFGSTKIMMTTWSWDKRAVSEGRQRCQLTIQRLLEGPLGSLCAW